MTKTSRFDAWFRQQYGPAPKRNATQVGDDLANAMARVRALKTELRRIERYGTARQYALYAWQAKGKLK